MENVTLKPKEQTRLQVLNSLLAEHMTRDQAATLLGVSPRHTRRILADYRKNGAASLAHGHRGRKPANAIPETTRSRVVHLARTVYEGANHTHLSALLSEREGLDMGRTTLRRILVNAGLSSPRRRRPPKHRMRRQRMPREGMLIQMDGRYHRWLGHDGPQFTILFAVDDATGCVLNALFCDHEDTSSYFLLMQGLLRRRGIPLALYTDRHAVFKHRSEYQPAGTPTQFGLAMEELGTRLMFALSPQAKGRVERTAGTFQDRLITELRLAGATTVEQTKAVLQQFLPRFNRRFGVPAQCPEPAFRPMGPDLCLEQVLCFKHRRRVARDNTVKFQRHTLQLLPTSATPQLRRSSCGGTGGAGRPAIATARGTYHCVPGSTAQSGISPKPQRDFSSRHHPALRSRTRVKTFGFSSRTAGRKAESRSRCSRCGNRRSGRSLVAGHRIAAEADVSPAREMEGGAAGQASGDVRSTDGERVGNPQRDGKEIHRRRESADTANPSNSSGTSI